MSRIVVFGAGGRAGSAAVKEARSRGHQVTAVVRNQAGPDDVLGDVTDATGVARIAEGHDAAIAAGYDPTADAEAFFTAAARALRHSGVRRLLMVGLASVLATEDGTLLMDTPGYPQEYRQFYLAHAAGLHVLQTSPAGVDWLVVSPAGDFDHTGAPTGRYHPAPADAGSRITYADLAVALLDEIDNPKHHRVHLGVEAG